MLWWLPRPRARIKRLDAQAEALICELGVDAYAEARRKEFEASSDRIAGDWGRVARVIAKRARLDAAHKKSKDADAAPVGEGTVAPEPRPNSELTPLDQLNTAVFARPQQFRVQFVGAAPGREPPILKEVGIEAADVSNAVVTAARLAVPPKTNGLHILDREGREVFARERANPGLQSFGRPESQVPLSGLQSWAFSQWRWAVETTHVFLSYVRKAQVQRRKQPAQATSGGTSSVARSTAHTLRWSDRG